jgi:hypothetical protein
MVGSWRLIKGSKNVRKDVIGIQHAEGLRWMHSIHSKAMQCVTQSLELCQRRKRGFQFKAMHGNRQRHC